MPYTGQYTSSTDDRRRLVIPAEIRSVFMQRSPYPGFWAVPDIFKSTPYLLCYDIAYFEKDKKLINKRQTEFCKIDSQGRTVLKEWLETIAHIREQAVIAASDDCETFEIWNPESFKETHEKTALEKIVAAARRIIRV